MASADILRAAHSPLPWAVKTEAYSWPQIVCPDPEDAEWPWIVAKCEGGCPNDKSGKNNAAFIVRACNAHYQMLEALKEVRALVGEAALTGFNWQDGDWPTKLFENQAKLSAAIRAAEAESR